MHPIRFAANPIVLGMTCAALSGCLGNSDDLEMDLALEEEAAREELGSAEHALNGKVVYPDSSCDSADNGYKKAIESALAHAYSNLNKWGMSNCLENAFFAWSPHAPEVVLDRLRQNMPTNVKCGHLGSALAEAPVNVSNETLTIDYDTLAGTTAGIAATILHEVAHNKGYSHQNDPNTSPTLKYYHTVEYSHTVPEQVAKCSQSVSAGESPTKPNARRRDELRGETTLAPLGGAGGSPFHLPCGIGMGLQVRSGNAINAVGPVCMSLVGGAATMAGGAGGVLSTMVCAGDEVMVGAQGRVDASKVVALGAICQKVGSVLDETRPAADLKRVGWAGGAGGVFFERWCPKGMVMTALKGRSGDLVDRLEIECMSVNDYDAPSHTKLAWAGGSGGSLQLEKCAGRAALEGLTFQADTRVKRMGGTCAEMTTNCSGGVCTESIGSARHFLYANGGTSGQVAQQRCAAGSALVGLQLRTGDLVDAAAGICANVTAWSGTGAAPTTNLALVGGGGGSATTRTCPRGTFMIGWEMRSGSAVDAVRPVCREFR